MNSFVGTRQSDDNGSVITELMRKKTEFPQSKLDDVGTPLDGQPGSFIVAYRRIQLYSERIKLLHQRG